MDCDDVILLLARDRTLTGAEETGFHNHVAGCESCARLTTETRDEADWRWVARLPPDAFDDPDLLVLPVVDPIVFAVGREIAAGGMGKITRARDRRLGRDVAIKEILEPELRARFEREAMITARLQHPAIVPIYEAGTWPNGSAFYTMRLVSGGTLANAIEATKTIEQRLALLPHVVAVTEALAYAHASGIIHRDLKPQNVLVGEFGETVVIDWGLAKELGRDDGLPTPRTTSGPDLTMVGSVIGTPCFMPPEQARGEELDTRADVFSLGAILYNVLTGEPPYWDQPRDTPDQLLEAAVQRPPTPIATLAPDAPVDLRMIVERAMARDPVDRYASAKEMAEELRRFQAGKLIAREYGIVELLARWIARHRGAVSVGSIAVVVLAVVGVLAVVNVTRSRDAERDARVAADHARVVAETARGSADASYAALLEEQGRNELLAGNHDRALAYLAEAYRRGRDTVLLRHDLAAAARQPALLRDTLARPNHEVFVGASFTNDGRVVTLDSAGSLDIWDHETSIASGTVGAVNLATFEPGGQALAVTTDDHVSVWDVSTVTRRWQVAVPAYAFPRTIFSPNGSVIAIIDTDDAKPSDIELRDGRTGTLRATFHGGRVPIADVAFSARGSIAVVTGDKMLHVLSDTTFAPVLTRSLPCIPTKVAFVWSDVAVGCDKRDVILVALVGQALPKVLPGHYGEITSLAATDRGTMLATADEAGTVRTWNDAGKLVSEAHDVKGRLERLTFSRDRRFLLGAGSDHRAFVWEVGSLALRAAVEAFDVDADSVAWAPDGKTFITLGVTEVVANVWNTPVTNKVARFGSDATITVGDRIVSLRDHVIAIVASTTGKQVRSHAVVDAASSLMSSGDGRRVLVSGVNSWQVFDLDTVSPTTDPNMMDDQESFELSADGRFVLDLGLTADKIPIRMFDATTGHLVRELSLPNIVAAALAPDGTRLIAVTHDQTSSYLVATGEPSPSPALGGGTGIRISASGKRLVVYGGTSTTVVDVATLSVIATLPAQAAGVVGVVMDDDAELVATLAGDRTAKLWRVRDGALLASDEGVADPAYALSRDGGRFATGTTDGTIRIWDTASGRLAEVIHVDHDAVDTLAWTADGTRLVAQSNVLGATIWDVHLEQRSPAQITELARASRWTVDNGLLKPR